MKDTPTRVHFNTDTLGQFVYGDEYHLCAMLEAASKKVTGMTPISKFNEFDCIGGVYKVINTGNIDIDVYSCGKELQPQREYPQRVILYARLYSGGNIGGVKMDFDITATLYPVEPYDESSIPQYCYYKDPFIAFMQENWFVVVIVIIGLILSSGLGYLYYRNQNKEINMVASNLSGKNNEAVELESSAFDMDPNTSIAPSFIKHGSQYPTSQYPQSSHSPRSHSPKRAPSRSPSRRNSPQRNQVNPYSSMKSTNSGWTEQGAGQVPPPPPPIPGASVYPQSPTWGSGDNRSRSRSPKRSRSRSPGHR